MVKPETSIPSLKAFAINSGFSNKTPLAPEKPKALNILRKCVGIEKTVLANCDTPFGNSNKFLYIQLTAASAPSLPSPLTNPWRPLVILLAFFNASIISFVVNLPCKGFTIFPAPGNSFTNSSTETSSIPVVLDLKASSPISFPVLPVTSSGPQKNPLPPAFCTSSFLIATLDKKLVFLETKDKLVIALNTEYLGSSTSPSSCLISFGGSFVSSITCFTKLAPGLPSMVSVIYLLTSKGFGFFTLEISLNILWTSFLASLIYLVLLGLKLRSPFCLAICSLKNFSATSIDSSVGVYLCVNLNKPFPWSSNIL